MCVKTVDSLIDKDSFVLFPSPPFFSPFFFHLPSFTIPLDHTFEVMGDESNHGRDSYSSSHKYQDDDIEAHDHRDSKILDRHGIHNAIHIGCSFCLVFLSFSVAQSFQTSSDHADTGSNALGVLYAFFTLFNFFSSWLVSTVGPRICVFLGSLTYVGFVAANIKFNAPVLYITSALLGIGAATLWTAHGVYITGCASQHERLNNLPISSSQGMLNGIFFFIFQVNQIVGSLLAALLFQEGVQQWVIFLIMTCICAVGSFSLLFLRPTKVGPAADSVTAIVSKRSFMDTMRHIFSGLKLLGEMRMIVILPIIMYSGLSQNYIFAEYPTLIDSKSKKYYVLAVIGASDALSSATMGRLSDKVGRFKVLLLGFVVHLAAYLGLYFWDVDQDSNYIFFLAGIAFGLGDGVFNTQIYAVVGTFFEKQTEHAFANFKLFQAGSSAIAFFYHSHFGFAVKSLICLVVLVLATLCLKFYELAHPGCYDCKPDELTARQAREHEDGLIAHMAQDSSAGSTSSTPVSSSDEDLSASKSLMYNKYDPRVINGH